MSKLRKEYDLDRLNKRAAEFLPGLLGVEAIALAEHAVTCRMPLTKSHFAPNGFVHGGAVVALADTACGYATFTHLPQGAASFTTVELKSNHLGTVREGALLCKATPQHLGRSTQVWDATVSDEATGRTIALFRCTQMILWPKAAG